MTEELAPVHGEGRRNGRTAKDIPDGYISMDEHLRAWAGYAQQFSGVSSKEILERGGFFFNELKAYLGQPPETWRPQDESRFADFELANEDKPWSAEKVMTPPASTDVGHIYYVGGDKSICSDDVVFIEPIYFDEEGKHCGKCLSKLILWIESWTKS